MKSSLILLFCLAFASITAAQDLLYGRGDATFYYDINGGGTCGPTNGITSYPSVQGYPLCETNSPNPKQLIDYNTNNIVAIPSSLLFANLDKYCGKRIIVTVDGFDRDDLNLVVWDGCAACNRNDGLDLSSTVFAQLFGRDRCGDSPIKGEVSWRIVDEQVFPYGDQTQDQDQNQDQETDYQQEDEEDQDGVEVDIDLGNNEEDYYVVPSQPVHPVEVEEEEDLYYEASVVVVEEQCLYCEKDHHEEEEEEESVYIPVYPRPEEEETIVPQYPVPEEEHVVPVYPTPEEEQVVVLYPVHEEEETVVPLYSVPPEEEEEEASHNSGGGLLYTLEPEEEEEEHQNNYPGQNK